MPFAVHYTSDRGAKALYIVLIARGPHDAIVEACHVLGDHLTQVDRVVPMDYVP